MKLKPRVLAIGLSIFVAVGLAGAASLPTPRADALFKPAHAKHLDPLKPLQDFQKATGMSQAERAASMNFSLGTGRQTALFLAAMTVMSASDGTGGTEATGGAYARVSVTDNATNFPTVANAEPSVLKLHTSTSFPAATADWSSAAPIVGFEWRTASTAGTFLGNMDALSSPIIVTADTTGLFTAPSAHGFTTNDGLGFKISAGGTIAAGINSTATWYVIASGLTTTAFKVSTAQGGSAVAITAAAIACVMRAYKRFVAPVTNGTTLTLPIDALQMVQAGF